MGTHLLHSRLELLGLANVSRRANDLGPVVGLLKQPLARFIKLVLLAPDDDCIRTVVHHGLGHRLACEKRGCLANVQVCGAEMRERTYTASAAGAEKHLALENVGLEDGCAGHELGGNWVRHACGSRYGLCVDELGESWGAIWSLYTDALALGRAWEPRGLGCFEVLEEEDWIRCKASFRERE